MAAEEIQLESDWKFQRKMWKAERIGAWIVGILLAATVAGLFGGGGILVKPRRVASESIVLEYAGLGRKYSPQTLEVRLMAGEKSFWIEESYFEKMRLEHIHPEPTETLSTAGRTVFRFAREGAAPLVVRLEFKPLSFGGIRALAGADSGPLLAIEQWIYP